MQDQRKTRTQNRVKTRLLVGGEKNAHGTRISKRIKCHKCGVVDYITARPRESLPCCKACAQLELNAYEVGLRMPKVMIERPCTNCSTIFELPENVKLKVEDQALCSNCMRGFEVWRGSLDMSLQSRQAFNCEKRVSGTLLRRRQNTVAIP